MGNLDRLLTVLTLQHHQIATLLPATSHRLQGLTVAGEQFMAMGSLQIGLITRDQWGEKVHQPSSQRSSKPSRSLSILSLAVPLTISVMWA